MSMGEVTEATTPPYPWNSPPGTVHWASIAIHFRRDAPLKPFRQPS